MTLVELLSFRDWLKELEAKDGAGMYSGLLTMQTRVIRHELDDRIARVAVKSLVEAGY